MKKYLVFSLLLGLLLLAAYGALISYDNDFKYGRMWETPAVKPHEEPLLVMEKGSVSFEDGEEIFKATPAEFLRSPLKEADPETLKKGMALYLTFCAQCHGKDYDGNGTVGQSFYPLPTDLRSPKVQSLAEGVLFKELSYGIPDGRQPPLSTTIETVDRWLIIAHIRSLGVRR